MISCGEVLKNLVFLSFGKIHKVFTVRSECTKTFTYAGIEEHQNDDKTITINQNSFHVSIQAIEVTKEKSPDRAASVI